MNINVNFRMMELTSHIVAGKLHRGIIWGKRVICVLTIAALVGHATVANREGQVPDTNKTHEQPATCP